MFYLKINTHTILIIYHMYLNERIKKREDFESLDLIGSKRKFFSFVSLIVYDAIISWAKSSRFFYPVVQLHTVDKTNVINGDLLFHIMTMFFTVIRCITINYRYKQTN